MRGIERDEQRRIRPQPPPARRVAAARRHVLRCRSSEMAPHRLRRGALNLTPWRSQRGPSQIDSHPLSSGVVPGLARTGPDPHPQEACRPGGQGQVARDRRPGSRSGAAARDP
jgi:hypothetical protein